MANHHQEAVSSSVPDISDLLERVERAIETVMALRVAIWDREWAGGKHREAPPKPTRACLGANPS